jgi:hypothetical protein
MVHVKRGFVSKYCVYYNDYSCYKCNHSINIDTIWKIATAQDQGNDTTSTPLIPE